MAIARIPVIFIFVVHLLRVFAEGQILCSCSNSSPRTSLSTLIASDPKIGELITKAKSQKLRTSQDCKCGNEEIGFEIQSSKPQQSGIGFQDFLKLKQQQQAFSLPLNSQPLSADIYSPLGIQNCEQPQSLNHQQLLGLHQAANENFLESLTANSKTINWQPVNQKSLQNNAASFCNLPTSVLHGNALCSPTYTPTDFATNNLPQSNSIFIPLNSQSFIKASQTNAPIEIDLSQNRNSNKIIEGWQPIQMQQPKQPQSPIQIQQPIQTQEPLQMEQFIQSLRPLQLEQPIQSQQSLQMQQPIQSQQPLQMQQLIQPQQSNQMQQPIQSQQPLQMQQLIQPQQSNQMQQPIQSQQPLQMQQLIQPQQSNQMQQPIQNQQPQQAQQPIQNQQSNQMQQPIQSQQPLQMQQPIQNQQPQQAQQPIQNQQSNQMQQPIQSQQPLQMQQPIQNQQPQQAQQPIQNQQSNQMQQPIQSQQPLQMQQPTQNQQPLQTQQSIQNQQYNQMQQQQPIQMQKQVQAQQPFITEQLLENLQQQSIQTQPLNQIRQQIQTQQPTQIEAPIQMQQSNLIQEPIQTWQSTETQYPMQVQQPVQVQQPGQSQYFQSQSSQVTNTPRQPIEVQLVPPSTAPAQSNSNQPAVVQLSLLASSNQAAIPLDQSQPSQQNQPPSFNSIISAQQQSSGSSPPYPSSPQIYTTKSRSKSSSMKALLPLILNLLKDKNCGCCCPSNCNYGCMNSYGHIQDNQHNMNPFNNYNNMWAKQAICTDDDEVEEEEEEEEEDDEEKDDDECTVNVGKNIPQVSDSYASQIKYGLPKEKEISQNCIESAEIVTSKSKVCPKKVQEKKTYFTKDYQNQKKIKNESKEQEEDDFESYENED